MGQPQQQEQEQVPAPATSAPAGDGRLPEGNAATLAAQLAAGGDSAMRLQQILANLPMVSTHRIFLPFLEMYGHLTLCSHVALDSACAANFHACHFKLCTGYSPCTPQAFDTGRKV